MERSALEIGAKKEHSYIIVQKKKGFCFAFTCHILLQTEKNVGKLDGKSSASFIPVGT